MSCGICKDNMPRIAYWRDQLKAQGLRVIAVHMPRCEADTAVEYSTRRFSPVIGKWELKTEPFERFFSVGVHEKPLETVHGELPDSDHQAEATVLIRSLRATKHVLRDARQSTLITPPALRKIGLQ